MRHSHEVFFTKAKIHKFSLKKHISVLVLILIFSLAAFSQGNTLAQISHNTRIPKIMELKVGDRLPDIEITVLHDNELKKEKISNHNVPIIFDFWATWCIGCVEMFPKMDSLQSYFSNKIKFMLVNSPKGTHDSIGGLINFFNRWQSRTGRTLSLDKIVNDSILLSYFPANSIPHYVWVDKDKKVVAITSQREITKENLENFARGERVNVRQKKDIKDSQYINALFGVKNINDVIGKAMYRSVLTGYREEFGPSNGAIISSTGDIVGQYFVNMPLTSLCLRAYNLQASSNKQIVLNVRNERMFSSVYHDSTVYESFYNYGLIVQKSLVPKLDYFMQQDLKNVLNISVRSERRLMQCLVLSPGKEMSKKGCENVSVDLEKESIKKYLRCLQLKSISGLLDKYFKLLVISESKDENRRYSVDLPYDLSNEEEVIKSLKASGILLHKENRMVDVIIISDIE